MNKERCELRAKVLKELESSGFEVVDERLRLPDGDIKEIARRLHSSQRSERIGQAQAFLSEWQEYCLAQFANGDEVVAEAIDPVITPVETLEDKALFDFAALTWSVPVSQGFGRRVRFLVRDQFNGKLVGIFALGDPVINLNARDKAIGWSREQKYDRLYSVFDAFVCGSVDPYRQLLAGKLMALLTISDEVLSHLENRYKGTTTKIRREVKDSAIAVVTTTSALGRSSVYNRLKLNGRLAFEPVGYTGGFGHFQFSDELFREILEVAADHKLYKGTRFGEGANWRIRCLRQGLSLLELSPSLIQHGIERQVFLATTGANSRDFLLGNDPTLSRYQESGADIVDEFKSRWAIPRAAREPRYKDFRASSMAFELEASPELTDQLL